MIPREWRFFSPEGALTPGGPHLWVVIDWDQRRWFQVIGPAKALPDEGDAIRVLDKYVDQLGADVHTLNINGDCELLSVSPEDPTWEIRYSELSSFFEKEDVLVRSKLKELDRLHVCTDLSQCTEDNKLVVFKYTIIRQRLKNVWDELHILKALRANEHFVPFHRVVVDDFSNKILGFTSEYIGGGNLETYNKTFYFHWLKQLTDAVDVLNLHFGVMHQDVAPRNILIDPSTNNLKLFDFDRSALIGSEKQQPWRNDVDGLVFTIYEALTKDDHYRCVPHHEQKVSEVECLSEWDIKLPLEDGRGGIKAYRDAISQWAIGRRTESVITHYSQASNPISWPEYKEPPCLWVDDPEVPDGGYYGSFRKRETALRVGDYVTSWERPPQKNENALISPRPWFSSLLPIRNISVVLVISACCGCFFAVLFGRFPYLPYWGKGSTS